MARASCSCCRLVFVGATAKSARNQLSRHRREFHVRSGALHRRREQQRARMALTRSGPSAALAATAPAFALARHLAVFITAPDFRESMYVSAVAHLVSVGCPISCIHRRRGIDFRSYIDSAGASRYPKGLACSTFLMYDFHKHFLPAATKLFDRFRDLTCVLWLEDDCRMKPGRTMAHVMDGARACEPSVGWLGYLRVGGQPRWQSHIVSVSRWSAPALKRELDTRQRQGTSPVQYLKGLDTMLRDLQAVTHKGHALVRALPESMACQTRVIGDALARGTLRV